jgi:hypothetical protein
MYIYGKTKLSYQEKCVPLKITKHWSIIDEMSIEGSNLSARKQQVLSVQIKTTTIMWTI